jgi:hypothetical protein
MRSDHNSGVWSGSKFSGWYVDAVNGLAGAGFARAAPRASAQSERTVKDWLGFYHTPHHRLSARRRGGSAMFPSEGTEHGVSSELLTGDPSGRPCPVR